MYVGMGGGDLHVELIAKYYIVITKGGGEQKVEIGEGERCVVVR